MEFKWIWSSKLELPLVTPVDGVVVYQSVSMEYSPQQDLDVAVFSQEEFWRALIIEGKALEVRGIAEVNECKANEAKKVTSVAFMMKEKYYSYIKASRVEEAWWEWLRNNEQNVLFIKFLVRTIVEVKSRIREH